MFYSDDDRHHTCNVCKSTYTCPPPTRAELMESFTGAEIAALIRVNQVIGSHAVFSVALGGEATGSGDGGPGGVRSCLAVNPNLHWVRGAYLITVVEADTGRVDVHLGRDDYGLFRRMRGTITSEGRTYNLEMPEGLLDLKSAVDLQCPSGAVPSSSSTSSSAPPNLLGRYLSHFPSPSSRVTVAFVDRSGPDCGSDHIRAVNLTRPIPLEDLSAPMKAATSRALARARSAVFPDDDVDVVDFQALDVRHYAGGPCDCGKVNRCLVMGGGGSGWTQVSSLYRAFVLALGRRGRKGPGGVGEGDEVEVVGLRGRVDLNGQRGVALKYGEEEGRWNVRLRDGKGVRIKPDNLTGTRAGGGLGKPL